MKKVICRKILFLFLLGIVPMFVNAKVITSGDVSTNCQNYINNLDDSDGLVSKYGLELKVDTQGNDYEVVMDTNNMDDSVKKKKNIEFKVARVEGYDEMSFTPDPNDSSKTILTLGSVVLYESDENVLNSEYISSANKHISKSNKVITIKKEKVTTSIFVVVLVPVGFSDSELTNACGEGTTFELTLSGEFNKQVPEQDEDSFPGAVAKLPIVPFTGGNKKIIDCNGDGFKSWDKDSFNYKFCEARSHVEDKKNTEKKKTVYCDVNKMDYTEDYYVNKDYFMITTEKEVNNLEPYRYNYTCDKESTYSPGECKIKCEEVVTVEYGPPVASKAGLCFEYKVQVISRVSCGVSQYPDPPKEEEKICTPLPVCTIPGSNIIHRQGGPNEDFDNCVIGCDGGVYSDRCTNNCYKKVYGKSKVRKTYGDEVSYEDKLQLLDGNSNATVEKTSNPPSLKYFCKNGNKIFWDGGQDTVNGSSGRNTRAFDSRWHNSNYWGHGNQSNYNWYGCTSNTGIPRNCGCGETCYWTIGSCRYGKVDDKNVVQGYMNPGEARDAYNKNVEIYNRNKSKCEKQATCSTSTATFTISTKVGEKKYEFPISGEDTIKRENNTVTSTFTSSNTTILKDSNFGCYNLDPEKQITDLEYGVAWSFPGTYINNKTEEIAYKVDNTNHWMFLKDKFCLPFNTSDVNQKWWNYYYTKKYQNKNTISFNTTEYKNNCTVKCNGFKYVNSISDVRGESNKDIEWNITANTTNFGHNDWNITIKCFYAANKDDLSLGKDTDKECKETCDQTTSTQKRIRSVDLSNLFPSSDGESNSRTPGFNWSASADNTIQNSNYMSLPSEYATKIQNKEKTGSVFDDSSELDYHFVLDRKAISELRKMGNNYTAYSGSFMTDNVFHYRSGIIDEYADKSPKNGSALRCNNLKNGVCDNTLTD